MKQRLIMLYGLIYAFAWMHSASAATQNDRVVANLLSGSTYEILDSDSQNPVLLKFWATWCVACLEEMPAYLELFEEYSERVRFVAVNVAVSDPRDRVTKSVDQFGLHMPVVYDESGDLWSRYGIVGTPAYVLLASDGTVLHRVYGHDDSLEPALDSAIAGTMESSIVEDANSSDRLTRASARSVVDIDGNRVELEPAAGEVLIGYSFAVWCVSYVSESYPELSKQCETFNERIQQLRDADLPGARLVGFVSAYSTEASSAARFRDKRQITEPIIFDSNGAYAARFGARGFPHITVVGPDGKTLFAGSQVPENIQQMIRSAGSDAHSD